MIKTLREMGSDKLDGNPQGLQQLAQAALERIQKLDYDLRKRTDTTNDQLFLSGSDEAPPQYRPLIDEYFRKLSKDATGARGIVKK